MLSSCIAFASRLGVAPCCPSVANVAVRYPDAVTSDGTQGPLVGEAPVAHVAPAQ